MIMMLQQLGVLGQLLTYIFTSLCKPSLSQTGENIPSKSFKVSTFERGLCPKTGLNWGFLNLRKIPQPKVLGSHFERIPLRHKHFCRCWTSRTPQITCNLMQKMASHVTHLPWCFASIAGNWILQFWCIGLFNSETREARTFSNFIRV